MVFGTFCFARVIQQLEVFGLKKQTSTTATVSGATKRRAEFTSLGPGLKHPGLRWLTPVWSRRDVPTRRRAAHRIFSTKHPNPARWLDTAAVCTLWYVATKDARWVRCSSWSLGPSSSRPKTVVCPRRGAATAFAHRRCIRNPTHWSLLVLLRCMHFAMRFVCVSGSAHLDFYLIKDHSPPWIFGF